MSSYILGVVTRILQICNTFFYIIFTLSNTVVPVMNGHPWDQAKVSVHDRWPLVGGTGGRRQT